MNTSNKTVIRKHVGVFRYHQREIRFNFWSNTSADRPSVDTVIFLGSGQSGRIARWIAKNAPAGTAVVEGLPHKEADRDARDLKEFARDYTSTAFLVILKVFKNSAVNIVAESQAAPGAIWTALTKLAQVNNVVLVAPLGFTAHILGNSPKERLRELKKRAFLSTLQFRQSPLYDPRNLYLGLCMLHAVLYDARWNVSGQKYAVGASYDVRAEARLLAEQLHKRGSQLTLLLGQHDRIFPPREVSSFLAEAKLNHIKMVLLKTSHASLAVREGKHILNRATQTARKADGH